MLEGRSLGNQNQNFDMGEGVSKTAKKIPTSFMDGPYLNAQLMMRPNFN